MQADALAQGHNLYVQSAYRTIERQRELYSQAGGDGAVARPGYSEHHTGRALDLGGPGGLLDQHGATGTGRWVAENAYLYGFIVRYTAANQHVTGYKDEPWHITFVGEAIAMAMARGGYGSLEEYIAKNPGAGLEF
jgi:D-alanyl-D-alanine carboxypeptidase